MLHHRGRRVPRRLLSAALMAAALWAADVQLPRAQSAAKAPAAVCAIETTERIVAVGDVHGAFDEFVAILQEAKLIDSRRRWTGGRAIFVQTGDVTDRGADSKKVIDLIRKLTDEAARAGGRVHALLGNHEAMRVMGDYRYVSAGEYAAFRTSESGALRDRYYELVAEENTKRAKAAGGEFDERAFRKQFFEGNPLGFVEMQIAFTAKGDYGRWLRERDTMVKINGIVFMHGGASVAVAPMGCDTINTQIRAELGSAAVADPNIEKRLSVSPDGPLWYRGLVDGSPGVGQPEVDGILTALSARAVVVGHTVADGFRIRGHFGGRVVQIDTGMLGGEYYKGGVPSALEIHGGNWTTIYKGQREALQPSIGQPPSTPQG